MRVRVIGAAAMTGALALSGCANREAGTDETGAVSTVTRATSTAAADITTILAGPAPSDTATSSASGAAPSATAATGEPDPGATALELPPRSTSDTLTIWAMPDLPGSVERAATKRFRTTYPKVDVSVVRQDWATIDSQAQQALPLRAETPDVIELANTDTAAYAAEGLLVSLESARTELRAGEWTPALTDGAEVDGALAAVPLYGYGRVVAYDKATWRAAGVTGTPTSLGDFRRDLATVQSSGVAADYSALWFPGRDWVGSLPWIWSQGGELAEDQEGTWVGTVDSSESQAGLTELQQLVADFSRAPVDGDQTTADAVRAFDGGRASAALMDPWQVNALTRTAGVFALPGVSAGTIADQLMQGSVMGVSAQSPRQGLAVAWLQALLDVKVQKKLARETGYLPALDAAVTALPEDPVAQVQAELARHGRFTPNVAQWQQVTDDQVLATMLQAIVTPVTPSGSSSATGSPGSPAGEAGPTGSVPGGSGSPGAGEVLPTQAASGMPTGLPSGAPSAGQ